MPANELSKQMEIYRDDMMRDIAELVRIPSTRGEPLPGKPFGEQPAAALAYCLALGEGFGLRVKNANNYAGHIEYGEGEQLLGVLCHVDVVPAGDGWTKDPFAGELQGERMYGRGTMDDKSQAVAAIYCLRALKDLGIRPKMRIRVILGAAEETGMEDMEYYFRHEKKPCLAFSPDSEYPICNREKGIMHVRFTAAEANSPVLLEAGSTANIVPDRARAVLSCGGDEARRILQLAAETAGKITAVRTDEGVELACTGRSAHASEPDLGVNAAMLLSRFLLKVLGGGADTEEAAPGTRFLAFLAAAGADNYGTGLGAACEDAPSGRMTCSIDIVKADAQGQSALADIRYPVTKQSEPIFRAMRETAARYGVAAEKLSDSAPLFVPEDSVLVRRLAEAYRLVTGEEGKTFSSGGGTYARALPGCCVAFGAGFRNLSYYNIHAADEFLEIPAFVKHSCVCLQAIYELACR